MVDWNLCILCQEKTDEKLCCPLQNPVASRRETAYTEITSLKKQFKAVDASPHPDIELPDEESMRNHHASWHRSCRHLYRETALQKAKTRHLKGLSQPRNKSQRAGNDKTHSQCLFCGKATKSADHSFQKLELTKQIHKKAVALKDERIITILAEGDLIAIEAKYHRNCYIIFNRRYEASIKQSEGTSELEDHTAIAENELLQFIHEEMAAGQKVFALQDLTHRLTEQLEQHGVNKKVNGTHLKEMILKNMPNLTEERGVRDKVYFVCSSTARRIVSDATQTPDEEARTLLLAASILRKAVLNHDSPFKFDGSFPCECEESSVPNQIKYFFRQLLLGPSSTPEQNNSRKVLSTSQVAMLNMTSLSANLNVTPPLSVFMALKLHAETRSRKLVELLHQHALSISYKDTLDIENKFAIAIADHTKKNSNIVCPTNLREKVFTVAALDNLDHNPTSRTACSSFHGTGISIFQFPSTETPGITQEGLRFNQSNTSDGLKDSILPQSYTFVPPVGKNLVTQPPYKITEPLAETIVTEEMKHEDAWMNAVNDSLYSDTHAPMMWSSFHAARADSVGEPQKSIEALLPLFHEKAASPEMIHHGMQLIKRITEHLNPNQIPVLVVDQPLYDLAKKIQWTFPDTMGEDIFVVMLGGLHIEMALWCTMGDLLRGSGWPEILSESGLAKTEAGATAFLKASNVMRTRYAHQVTVMVLDVLLKRSYKDSGNEQPFEDWILESSTRNPTFKFWLFVYNCQKLIFLFIRAHRERKFTLMVCTLKKLVTLFFALDHQNYARWIPVYIRDLESLPPAVLGKFEEGYWTVSRSKRRFSSLPVDHAHEQANKRVKGVGGMIGLTENPVMLERWIATGPEISRVLEEFVDVNENEDELPHHEEGITYQNRFRCHVKDFIDVLLMKGNPFEEDNIEQLVTLQNKVCQSPAAVLSVLNIESIGLEQYENFNTHVLNVQDISLFAPIRRNNLLLYHEEKVLKTATQRDKVQHFKHQAELYGKSFVVLDSRGGDLEDFFRHESAPYPPALSCKGLLNSCTKSDLLACILRTDEDELFPPHAYNFIVHDGGALIHSLTGKKVQGQSFDAYFSKVFSPYIHYSLLRSTRVDIVWDDYRSLSVKGGTRLKRKTGTRQRVTGSAKVPGNWQNFLGNSDNKKELFAFLSHRAVGGQIPAGKNLYITAEEQVKHVGEGLDMEPCNHEEADTRILVHILHALKTTSVGMIYTGDTDVVVILLCNFHHIKAANPAADIWISFHSGKTTKMISLNATASQMGSVLCKAMALFHAFTGADSTSSFKYKGKRHCWKTLNTMPSVITQFATIADRPFHTSQELYESVREFVCKLYCTEQVPNNDVNLARMILFSQKTRDVERIPPTNDALEQHLKRSIYQASIWTSAHLSQMPDANPVEYAWKVEGDHLVPIWTTQPLAKDVFHLDVKCACSKPCSYCKCVKSKLKCTRLCKCKCSK